jgi:CubicO group peptidase (beta-lactamase class C family)
MSDLSLKLRVDLAVDRALSEKRIVGTVVLVARDGQLVYARAAGLADREAGRPMDRNAIFRLASLTKPLVSATALAMVERGILGLDDCVTDHLPYFRPTLNGAPARITVRHLLTHTSGLSYDSDLIETLGTGWGLSGPIVPIEEITARISRMPLKFEPGTAWEYSLATDALGGLVAAVNGSTLDEAIQRYVTGPLGMIDTRFRATDPTRLASPYDGPPEPQLMSDPHRGKHGDGSPGPIFSPGRIFNEDAPQSGGGGMAGTADDFLKFLEALRTGGAPILGSEILNQALSNQIGDVPGLDPGRRFGWLGAVLDDPIAAESPQAKGTVSWGGVYGHTWFVDAVNGLSVVSLTNTAWEGCLGAYPREIRNAVYG